MNNLDDLAIVRIRRRPREPVATKQSPFSKGQARGG